MSPVRRIYLYWGLLLVPTLVAGAAAFALLRREQARIFAQAGEVEEARRGALEARARLVAENLELLAGDVEAGLLDTLSEVPADGLESFIRGWPRDNPLVRAAFLSTDEGRLLVPGSGDSSESARGFRRRFEQALREHGLWRSTAAVAGAAKSIETDAGVRSFADRLSRPGTSAIDTASTVEPGAPAHRSTSAQSPAVSPSMNIAPVQSARRDVQQLARARPSPAAGSQDAFSARERLASAESTPERRIQSGRHGEIPAREGAVAAGVTVAESKDEVPITAPPAAAKSVRAETAKASPAGGRRGWQAVVLDQRPHVFGWVTAAGPGPVRGVELELAALAPRLVSTLPAGLADGETLVLRDMRGRQLGHAGAPPPSSGPVIRIPLESALLRGWSIEAILAPGKYGSLGGDGFLVVGGLLVGILAVAILAGGSLLLWQARSSAIEVLRKSSFVSNVSHEFKTPLTTIRLYAELLEQQRVADPERRLDYLRTISRETQRLARLVNNVLDFSRLEQGRKQYRPETLDLAAEIGRILASQQPRLAEAGMAVRLPVPSAPARVSADRDALEQILLNLVDNACKYAASGGELTLGILHSAPGGGRGGATGTVELSVADRGPGVPGDQRGRIFEKFHRVDDRLTAEQGGAGLGLSIARQLARGMGGDLACAGRPGGGAVFILSLPAAAGESAPDDRPPPPSPSAGAKHP